MKRKSSQRVRAMRKGAILAPILVAVLFRTVTVSAESPDDILIIVNSSVKNEKVTQDDLRAIFLKKRTTWSSGIRAVPIYSKNILLHDDFRARLLKMSGGEEDRYWQKLQIKEGTSKPPSFSNTLKAVFRLKGGVSYIYRSQYLKGVTNVILVLPAGG